MDIAKRLDELRQSHVGHLNQLRALDARRQDIAAELTRLDGAIRELERLQAESTTEAADEKEGEGLA